jgi:hypothetical protein
MRFGVQKQQTLLVTTELVVWRYANAFIFTNQSEVDFGIALVSNVLDATPVSGYTNRFNLQSPLKMGDKYPTHVECV